MPKIYDIMRCSRWCLALNRPDDATEESAASQVCPQKRRAKATIFMIIML